MALSEADMQLEKSRELYLKQQHEEANRKALEAWEQWEDAFRDYLNGLTVPEVMKKHKLGNNRRYFYNVLERFKMPVIPMTPARELAYRLRRAKNEDKRLAELMNCPCATCIWVKARLKLIKSGHKDR